MPRAPIIALALVVTATTPALAQLPATPPTAIPQATTPQPSAAAPPEPPAQRADVTFTDGLLTVRADNSSLNQILQSISRRTGMRISGGVTEQRVFGTYGPASPSAVLTTLLDGTGTNILILAAANGVPASLVLTPRGGGPTPPSPPPASADRDPEERPALVPETPLTPATRFPPPQRRGDLLPIQRGGQPPQDPRSTPPDATRDAPQQPVIQQDPDDPSQHAATLPQPASSDPATNTATPSGPPTADSVYQQLLRLQKSGATPPAQPNNQPPDPR